MSELSVVCEQANLVESVRRLCDGSGYEDYVEIRLKNGQTITIELWDTINIRSYVANGIRTNERGGREVNQVCLVNETFTQRG